VITKPKKTIMGKGDKKSKKGKIAMGSYGVSRKRKKKNSFVGKPVKQNAGGKDVKEEVKAAKAAPAAAKKAAPKKTPAKAAGDKKTGTTPKVAAPKKTPAKKTTTKKGE
jgi:ribosomal small subunit protein bTHX